MIRALVAVLVLAGCTHTSAVPVCDTTLTVTPVIIRGDGVRPTDLDLKARVTDAGKPVRGVRVEFRLAPPDIFAGTAATDADGVAHLHEEKWLRPSRTMGYPTADFRSYRAEISIIQTVAELCIKKGRGSFRYLT